MMISASAGTRKSSPHVSDGVRRSGSRGCREDIDIVIDNHGQLEIGHLGKGLHAGLPRLVAQLFLHRYVANDPNPLGQGPQLILKIRLPVDEEGVYWFNVFFDEELVTRMPLRVVYQHSTVPATQGSPTEILPA